MTIHPNVGAVVAIRVRSGCASKSHSNPAGAAWRGREALETGEEFATEAGDGAGDEDVIMGWSGTKLYDGDGNCLSYFTGSLLRSHLHFRAVRQHDQVTLAHLSPDRTRHRIWRCFMTKAQFGEKNT